MRDHEPDLALFAGSDGQDAYRLIERQAREALRLGGRIVLEIGSIKTREIFAAWDDVNITNDLAGRACMLTATAGAQTQILHYEIR